MSTAAYSTKEDKVDFFNRHKEEILKIAKQHGRKGGIKTHHDFLLAHPEESIDYPTFLKCAKNNSDISFALNLKKTSLCQ